MPNRRRLLVLAVLAISALLALWPALATGHGTLGVDRTTMLPTGGTLVRSDPATQVDPVPLWGSTADTMVSPSRCVTANGVRTLTVQDGDNAYGERTQLGRNGWNGGEGGSGGTFKLAHEGDHFIVFFSMRFPASFPFSSGAWQQILQWKQAQPYSNSMTATRNPDGNGVALELQPYGGQLHMNSWWHTRWQTPVPVTGKWIRFALDVHFSQYTSGSMQLYVDRNGDGDFLDSGEVSPVWTGATLLYATQAHDGLAAGQSVPSYLALGIYHDSSYGTTTLDLKDVQVWGP